MRIIGFAAFLVSFCIHLTPAFAYTSIWCVGHIDNPRCASASAIIGDDADKKANEVCTRLNVGDCSRATNPFEHQCVVVGQQPDNSLIAESGQNVSVARQSLVSFCKSLGVACGVFYEQCDTGPASFSIQQNPMTRFVDSLDFLTKGILFALGVVIVTVLYAKRAPLVNAIIHCNLPYELAAYGEDVQCIFKRTQRINWYGRVIFGLVTNLSMTKDQLADVRKYWLGRVVAFDSLRRERQNQLAQMHMQLAASATSEAHDKKSFWSRRWATVRTFLRRLFWIFAALFRFLFSFLFIRVNIAKLVRGTIIESKDLTLILQAKEAIEETATYLKEYLTTANTFDGRDEIV
jgi:hypothetical protein